MGNSRRSTLRPYWLDRARCSTAGLVVGCRLGTLVALILQPCVGSTGNGPCGFTLPLQCGTRNLIPSQPRHRRDGSLARRRNARWFMRRVQRQAEPSASREVLIPYSVRQPRCALSGAAGTRTIPLRRSRPSHLSVTDVRLSDRTLALAVLRSAPGDETRFARMSP